MKKNQNGFALVIVIWMLTLLSLMAGSFALSLRRENAVTMALKNNAAAKALTESGFSLAQYMLSNPVQEDRWLADGSIYQFRRVDGSEVRIKIVAETGKVDINASDDNQLSAVIKAVTNDSFEEQMIFNRILDWKDQDNDTRIQGAEKKQYADAGLNYGPRNMPFQTIDELQMVMGMEIEMFNKLKPWITIYSGQSQVNIEMASPDLAAIINDSLMSGNMPTSSTNPPTNNQAPPPSAQNNGGAPDNNNGAYTIFVEVKTEDGGTATLEAVTKLQGGGNPSQPPAGAPGQPPGGIPGLSPGGIPVQAQARNQVLNWQQNQPMLSLFKDISSPLILVQDEFTNNNRY